MGAKAYVLGTGGDELERLALQHRLWGDAAHEAWRHARIQPGMRVLDVGCGPGFASFDLAQLVTGSGAVVGVDESAGFVEHFGAQCAARGLSHARAHVGDVQRLGEVVGAEATFDAAYARWVLCFVRDPGAVVRGVAAALKPGGRFVVHDYFNYTSMTMAPRRASFAAAVAATARSWMDRGGDPDVCARVPALMREAGLRVVRLHVHQRLAWKGETMLQWMHVWWRIYTPKLVQMGYLPQSTCDELMRDLDDAGGDGAQFICAPPVFEIIGEKA